MALQFYLVGGAVRNLHLRIFVNSPNLSSIVDAVNAPNTLNIFDKLIADLQKINDDNQNKSVAEEVAALETYLQSDIDILVVGAQPELLTRKGFLAVGHDFPVFLHKESHIQYALARTERKNGRGYHGFEFFTNPDVTLEEDLRRRDFTINAMALKLQVDDDFQPAHITQQLLQYLKNIQTFQNLQDPYHGLADLQNKKLRHISPNFGEDPLRILRLARFAAQYAFHAAPETIELIHDTKLYEELPSLSAERFFQEWQKALSLDFSCDFLQFLNILGQTKAFDFLYDTKNFKENYFKHAQLFLKPTQNLIIKTYLKKDAHYLDIIKNLNLAWPIFDFLFFKLKNKVDNQEIDPSFDVLKALQGFQKRLALPKKLEKNIQIYLKSIQLIEKIDFTNINNMNSIENILQLFNAFNLWHQPDEIEHLLLFLECGLPLIALKSANQISLLNLKFNMKALYDAANQIQAQNILTQMPELKGPKIAEELTRQRILKMIGYFAPNH